MNNIIATWVVKFSDAEDAPMCSFSERDEVIDESHWEYVIPDGYKFFKKPNPNSDSIPITGNGEVIGYAVKRYSYILCDMVFEPNKKGFEEMSRCDFFHPSDWMESFSKEEQDKIIKDNLELLEEGGWGD